MKVFTTLLGLTATLLAGAAADNVLQDCMSGGDAPFGGLLAIGDIHDDAPKGIEICETQWKQGNVVTGIEVWATKNNLAGYQLYYTGGQKSHMIGSKEGDHYSKLEWDPKTVTISKLHLWSNPQATRTGKVYIELSDGRTLDVGMDKPAASTHYMEVGSGVLLGTFGKADSAIVALGFIFLESKVTKISLNDFKFEEDMKAYAAKQKGYDRSVSTVAKHYGTTTNGSTIWGEVSVAATQGYTHSTTLAWKFGLGYSLEVSGEFLGMGAKEKFDFNFEMTTTMAKEWSSSKTVTETFKVQQPAVSGKTTMCVGYLDTGKFASPYTATATLTLENGKTFSFTDKGTKEEHYYATSETRCRDEDGDHMNEDAREFVEKDGPPKSKRAMKFIA